MKPPLTPDFLNRIRDDWEQVRPDLDPGPMLAVVLLERLNAALGRQIGRTYLPSGINAAGWDLLLTLYRSAPPEGLTPTGLSDLAAITGPSVTNRIQRLVGKNLVERRGGEDDRRSVRIRLTREGRALVERLLPQHLAATAQVLSVLSLEETQMLRHLAARVLAGLEVQELDQEDGQAPG
ncbi:DNA-binding MarR family transcriptional regulator [Deinococcus budaensis]|uniref:DNA-binding MarR family transcriptional regulator n=1 Tax=Deinococcus budaensis TaxID=1665626 RepID=A0A7W8GFK3_9DEIO|nr:MarR family transcriptional regulator [Deinococcus budaensis]MBB5234752.1 DNA-binding MarR family transcriptional regulator [Deinococcus budaensis]